MEYPEIFESFSMKEKMVFNFMLQSIKQERIAYILGINKNTVATYCFRVKKKWRKFCKLGILNRRQSYENNRYCCWFVN